MHTATHTAAAGVIDSIAALLASNGVTADLVITAYGPYLDTDNFTEIDRAATALDIDGVEAEEKARFYEKRDMLAEAGIDEYSDLGRLLLGPARDTIYYYRKRPGQFVGDALCSRLCAGFTAAYQADFPFVEED